TGRARDRNETERFLESLSEKRQVGRCDAERLHPQIDPAPIEDAEHRVFAVDGRKGRHAEVDQATVDAGSDPPILGQPALGDVEARQDLETAQERRLIRLCVGRSVLENAVYAVSNLDG